jgi:hypothetical protein
MTRSTQIAAGGERMRKMVLPAVALVALMLCFFVVPAAAAKITYRYTAHNITHPPLESGPICGVIGPNTVTFTDKELSYTIWDNGHYVAHLVYVGDVFDTAGNLIAHQSTITKQVSGSGGLPSSFGFYGQFKCTGKSATPGLLFLYHYGMTIGADGTIKEIHFVSIP